MSTYFFSDIRASSRLFFIWWWYNYSKAMFEFIWNFSNFFPWTCKHCSFIPRSSYLHSHSLFKTFNCFFWLHASDLHQILAYQTARSIGAMRAVNKNYFVIVFILLFKLCYNSNELFHVILSGQLLPFNWIPFHSNITCCETYDMIILISVTQINHHSNFEALLLNHVYGILAVKTFIF